MITEGTRLERYIVEREIGEGGMATVYRVRHAALGSPHALKLLHSRGSGLKERLLQEGRLQATLRHRNIVAVTDVIDIDGSPGLVMEFVPGQPLDAWLGTAPYDLQARLAIFKGILAGVGAAHAAGLVHRDLKPANVLLDMGESPPVPKVADFGIAKLLEEDGPGRTRSGMAMGTLVYMSPEQTRNAKGVDSRCDIYALACMLYEMVCEQRAFDGSDLWEVLQRKMGSRYTDPRELRPDLPESVLIAIRHGLAPDVDARLPDVETFAAVLNGTIDQQEIERRLIGARRPPGGSRPAAETMFGLLDEPEGSLAPTPAPTGPTQPSVEERSASVPVDAPGTIVGASGSTPRSALVGAAMASAATALLLGGAFAVWTTRTPVTAPASVEPSSEPASAPASDLAAAPVQVPPAAPTAAAVAPLPLNAAPAPAPSVAPAAAPTRPTPVKTAVAAPTAAGGAPPAVAPAAASPAATAPVTAPAVPAAAGTGTVSLTGPISAAWLEDAAGERHKPGALPPGTYQLRVRFEGADDFVPAATVNLRAGQSATYRCDASFGLCKRGD